MNENEIKLNGNYFYGTLGLLNLFLLFLFILFLDYLLIKGVLNIYPKIIILPTILIIAFVFVIALAIFISFLPLWIIPSHLFTISSKKVVINEKDINIFAGKKLFFSTDIKNIHIIRIAKSYYYGPTERYYPDYQYRIELIKEHSPEKYIIITAINYTYMGIKEMKILFNFLAENISKYQKIKIIDNYKWLTNSNESR